MLTHAPHAEDQPRSIGWGSDPSVVFYLTTSTTHANAIWAMPVTGGTSRLVLRLDGPGWVQRVQRFATNGKQVFFTLANDEADVWVMELSR